MINMELLAMYRAAVNAVKPNNLIRNSLQIGQDGMMNVFERRLNRTIQVGLLNRDIYVFGAGKAVFGMCEEMLRQVDLFNSQASSRINITGGRVNIPIGSSVSSEHLLSKYNISYQQCARNNIPDEDSCQSTKFILDLLQKSNGSVDPLVIGFISGGGSALLSLPKTPISIEDKRMVIEQLAKAGANIVELNTVRSCLSEVKHGKLARRIVNDLQCQLVTFIISDVIHDPLEYIASGPTVYSESKDPSSKALAILRKYQIRIEKRIEEAIRRENPIDTNQVDRIENIIVGNNSIALDAAAELARDELKLKVINCGSNLNGEAENVVHRLFQSALQYRATEEDRIKYSGICWIGGGETTINMSLGGRCQEMGLILLDKANSAQLSSTEPFAALFAGTDGQDGPTPAAGVLLQIPTNVPEQVKSFLANHDSYNFYKNFLPNSLIETGPSGTNVMDIYCILTKFQQTS